MRVRYIPNYRKVDSIAGVGLIWEPGQEREVTPELAERLLVYKDTWEVVEPSLNNKDAEDKDKDEPIAEWGEPIDLKPQKVEEEPLEIINFHDMSKQEMLEFAETRWNEKFDKRLSEKNLRERIILRHNERQNEQ